MCSSPLVAGVTFFFFFLFGVFFVVRVVERLFRIGRSTLRVVANKKRERERASAGGLFGTVVGIAVCTFVGIADSIVVDFSVGIVVDLSVYFCVVAVGCCRRYSSWYLSLTALPSVW